MRVLVIGGTNFIGPYVVRRLHQQGHEISVYHRGQHEPDLPAGVRHIHSPRAGIPVLHLPSELSHPAPDVVLHMFPVGEDDTRAAVARFAGVARRMVAVSSGDVYRAYGKILGMESGPPEPVPLSEDAPLREVHFPYRQSAAGPSDWTYHYEKILAERALLGGPIRATVLRLPAVYGPGDPHHRFRPYIKRMQDQRPAIALEQHQAAWRWSHGYVEDVAAAIALAVTNEPAAARVFNVGEPDAPSTVERITRLGKLMGWSGRLVRLPDEQLPQHLRAPYQPTQDLVLDTGRIRAELGFSETDLPELGLRRTVDWELSQPALPGDPDPQLYALEDAALSQGRPV